MSLRPEAPAVALDPTPDVNPFEHLEEPWPDR
jgi:hypothetical protein